MSLLPEISRGATLLLVVLTPIVHVAISVGVYRDASERVHRREFLYLLSPLAWFGVTLLTGLLGMAFYWLAHSSTLGREK
jgi:hypothetical protein